jgi:hypothetical protein
MQQGNWLAAGKLVRYRIRWQTRRIEELSKPCPRAASPLPSECLSNHVGFHLRLAQLAVFEHIGRAMKDIDVTPAIFSVLEVLHENDGITQSKLAAAVQAGTFLSGAPARQAVEARPGRAPRLDHRPPSQPPAPDRRRARTAGRGAAPRGEHEKEVCKPFTIAEKKMLLELLGRFRQIKKTETA